MSVLVPSVLAISAVKITSTSKIDGPNPVILLRKGHLPHTHHVRLGTPTQWTRQLK